jgi:GNAT superfamily N-acetyltransferase
MFATASLAVRIERAECGSIEEMARAARARIGDEVVARPIAGGLAVYAGQDSPVNKLAGLGFAPVPAVGELEAIEQEFGRRCAPLQVEFASLGDPAIPLMLTGRGYELIGFENVMGLALDAAALTMPDDSSIRVERAGPEKNTVWMDAVADGFLHPDVFDGPPSHESFNREAIERVFGDTFAAPGFERIIALRDGVVAGGASLRLHQGVALLAGAATRPEHRRRGVQTALLNYRLRDAAARGCDIAVVTTQPGSKSTENVMRFGFSLLYVRAILVKRAR